MVLYCIILRELQKVLYCIILRENNMIKPSVTLLSFPSIPIPQVKPTPSPATIPKYQLSITTAKQSKSNQSKPASEMAGGFPIMQAYRPVSTPTTVNSEDPNTPTVAVSRPTPQNIPEEWAQTAKDWSQILARATEHCRRHQLEVLAAKEARETRESVTINPRTTIDRPAPPRTESQHAAWIEEAKTWSRDFALESERREQREKAHARANAQVAELAFYERMWSTLYAGLVISAFLFLILFTDVF